MNLDHLYRSLILDHAKNPRHKGLKGYPFSHLRNPACGDEVTMEASVVNDVIVEVNHDGHGCSICCASASIACSLIKGKDRKKALYIIEQFYKMIKGEEALDEEALDEALALAGVSQFPARHKCAIIAWQALSEVLGENNE